jgi:hypothetical protein
VSKHHGTSRVAFALAVGVAISLVVLAAGVFFAIADEQQQLSAEASTLASAVLGGAVGALATYLGQGHRDDGPPHSEPPPWSDEDNSSSGFPPA